MSGRISETEGWGSWLSKEPTSAFKVSGLARGHEHNNLTGAAPDQLVSLGRFTAGLF